MVRNLVLILLAGLNFSFLFPVNVLAFRAGIPATAYVFWYALGAGAIVLAIALAKGQVPRLAWPHLKSNLISGLLGFAFPFALLAFVSGKLPTGIAALLIVLTPAFTYLVSLAARASRFHPMPAAGLVLAVIGVLVMVVPAGALPTPDMAGWFLLALLVPFCFAVLNVYVQLYRPPAAPDFALASGLLFAGVAGLAVLVVATGQYYLPFQNGDPQEWALPAAMAINAIVWPFFFYLINRTGAVLFSMMNVVGLVFGTFWGILIFADSHSPLVWVAGLLMLVGFFLVVLAPQAAPAAAAGREAA
ncbi:DMT family transporter [Marinibaculum pumilum]|uniref:DMT family transporter n=1 Tax=Marinibaculum pumilum TaxID=1766165 RepID=A0ABV7KWX6_9PROT